MKLVVLTDIKAKLNTSAHSAAFVRDTLPGVLASMKKEWKWSNIPRAVLHDKGSYFVNKRGERHAKTYRQSLPKLSLARSQALQI